MHLMAAALVFTTDSYVDGWKLLHSLKYFTLIIIVEHKFHVLYMLLETIHVDERLNIVRS